MNKVWPLGLDEVEIFLVKWGPQEGQHAWEVMLPM